MKKLILTLLITITLSAQKWTRNGPFSASVLSLAVAPSDSNVIYIGTYCDGVYKTIDGAENWSKCPTANLPEWPDSLDNSPTLPCWWFGEHYPINDIAIDPNDSEHLWIGFGSRGLFESLDGGNSWDRTDPSLPDTLDVDYIHVNNLNPDKIFIGAGNHNYNEGQSLENGGLYYTEDGGNNWALVDSVPHGNTYRISCITNVPGNENHIFVGISSAGEPDFAWGLMESRDGGVNWNILSEKRIYHDVFVNPSDILNLFSIVYTGYLDFYLAESEDGGNTWTLDYTENWVTRLYADKDFNLYAVEDANVKKSVDNGITWSNIDTFCAGRGVNLRNRCETNYSNVENIYFGAYLGIYKSNDGGLNCDLKNRNLSNSYIKDIEIHPFDNNIVYAGGGQGLWKSIDGCETWDQVNDENVNVIRYDQTNPDTLYYGGQNLMRSYDGGVTFTDIRNGIMGDVVDIKIDPTASNIIYSVTGGFTLYKSIDYGSTWDSIHGCVIKSYPMVIIDPNNPETLYFSNQRSLNGGSTWSDITSYYDEVVAVHPYDSNIIFFSDRNELTVTYDWGKTFQVLDTYTNWFAPVPAIGNLVLDNNNPDNMFYCTPNNGIHYTNNAGLNWMVLNGDYEKRTLDVIPLIEEDKIYIATYGDGVWVGENVSLGIDNEQLIINNYELNQNYPNPFNPTTEISYALSQDAQVSIKVYNSNGSVVADLVNAPQSVGHHSVEFGASKLSNGIFYYSLVVNGRVVSTKKMLLLK